MKRLFGTDGIRARAGESPLDPPGVRRFGAALAEVLAGESGRGVRVALGRDTRESGPWLRDAVAAGLAARGAEAMGTGIITTPGLAHVVKTCGFDAGVMISASHNPYLDNGLKVFGRDGSKLSDALEAQVERRILDHDAPDPGETNGAAPEDAALRQGYIRFLETRLGERSRFAGLRLALDCSNGSACAVAPEVFRFYGADVRTIGDEPDGRNINLGCGSLHLERLAATVVSERCDVGLAFDGDADRCLAVDRRGRTVDGDHILFLLGRRMRREGRLRGDSVVATIMSNLWLEHRLAEEGVRLCRAPVGDKYVLDRMLDEDLMLGGEQSGHIIFREHSVAGDGILTGLLVLDTVVGGAEPLETTLDGITPYPQVLLNVRVREKPDLRRHARIGPVVAEVEERLAGQGRVVLRYSGTEPLARVMLEGRDEAVVRAEAERLASAVRDAIGA